MLFVYFYFAEHLQCLMSSVPLLHLRWTHFWQLVHNIKLLLTPFFAYFPSVPWHYWLDNRKGDRVCKKAGCWFFKGLCCLITPPHFTIALVGLLSTNHLFCWFQLYILHCVPFVMHVLGCPSPSAQTLAVHQVFSIHTLSITWWSFSSSYLPTLLLYVSKNPLTPGRRWLVLGQTLSNVNNFWQTYSWYMLAVGLLRCQIFLTG